MSHDLGRDAVGYRTEEEDLAAFRVLDVDGNGRPLHVANVLRADAADCRLQGKVLRLVVPLFDHRTVVHPLQALEHASVDDDVDVADQAAVRLGVDVLDLVRRALPGIDLELRVRDRVDLIGTVLVRFVAEKFVRDGVDEGFTQVRVADVDTLADDQPRRVFRGEAFVEILRRDDHGLATRVGLEDVDAVETERSRVGDRVQGREARHGILAEQDAGHESLDVEESAFERREVELVEAGVIVDEVREEPGQRGRIGHVDRVVKDKLGALAERVASTLFGGQARFAGVHRRKQALLVDEGDLDNRFPLLLLAVHVVLERGRVKVDDRRGRVRHEIAERGRDVLGREVGQDAHELLERPEGLAELKVEPELVGTLEVCRRQKEKISRDGRSKSDRGQKKTNRSSSEHSDNRRTSPTTPRPCSNTAAPTGDPQCIDTRVARRPCGRPAQTRVSPVMRSGRTMSGLSSCQR